MQETKKLKRKISGSKGTTQIVGESEGIKQVREMIAKVAPSDARVLITGGNGTGKELVARSLHEQSDRNKAPFIEVNCAAIPSELIESELFGHEKGAFTGAIQANKGLLRAADGGAQLRSPHQGRQRLLVVSLQLWSRTRSPRRQAFSQHQAEKTNRDGLRKLRQGASD